MGTLTRSSLITLLRRTGMSSRTTNRTLAIARHVSMNTTADNNARASEEPPVLFKEDQGLRTYILNRPNKLNALDEPMLNILRPKLEEWSKSELCGTIVGTGVGRAFCAGGDVASVVENAAKEDTRPKAIDFFKREFELDYILSTLNKPYVVLMDGFTMGGGAGLSFPAPFRVATENTLFAMPETKIGYCPDVGANYFLGRLDGQLGTYLALTGDTVKGRAVFELGFATHYIPSSRLPSLLSTLASLASSPPASSHAHLEQINRALEELHDSRSPSDPPTLLTGKVREALDKSFAHDNVETIFDDLKTLSVAENEDGGVKAWARATLEALELRSPTSLKVALVAVRRGREMALGEVLGMELGIAAACCSGASPDFSTGVRAVLIDKIRDRPAWSPPDLASTPDSDIITNFFDPPSPFLSSAPRLDIPSTELKGRNPMRWALPTERAIKDVVTGSGRGAGGLSVTLDEVVERLGGNMKDGVREKVEEVVGRKCEVVDNGDGEFKWLKWKH